MLAAFRQFGASPDLLKGGIGLQLGVGQAARSHIQILPLTFSVIASRGPGEDGRQLTYVATASEVPIDECDSGCGLGEDRTGAMSARN